MIHQTSISCSNCSALFDFCVSVSPFHWPRNFSSFLLFCFTRREKQAWPFLKLLGKPVELMLSCYVLSGSQTAYRSLRGGDIDSISMGECQKFENVLKTIMASYLNRRDSKSIPIKVRNKTRMPNINYDLVFHIVLA